MSLLCTLHCQSTGQLSQAAYSSAATPRAAAATALGFLWITQQAHSITKVHTRHASQMKSFKDARACQLLAPPAAATQGTVLHASEHQQRERQQPCYYAAAHATTSEQWSGRK